MSRTHIIGTGVAVVVMAAAAFAAAVEGATPKPWQWTPALAAQRVIAEDPSVYRPPLDSVTLVYAGCVGRGESVNGRYSSFQCSADFLPDGASGPDLHATLWVRVRRVGNGQPCVSLVGFAAIPRGCLSTSGPPRVRGSVWDARLALRRAMATRMGRSGLQWNATIVFLGYGAGFYTCTFANAGMRGQASVTFTTRGPIVKVTAIECLLRTERPGCRL